MKNKSNEQVDTSRRNFLKSIGAVAAGTTIAGCTLTEDVLDGLLRSHFSEMSKDELGNVLADLERTYSRDFGKSVSVGST